MSAPTEDFAPRAPATGVVLSSSPQSQGCRLQVLHGNARIGSQPLAKLLVAHQGIGDAASFGGHEAEESNSAVLVLRASLSLSLSASRESERNENSSKQKILHSTVLPFSRTASKSMSFATT